MVERLLDLVREYQTKIREAASLFQTHKGIDPGKLMYWKRTGLSREGFIDPERRIEYSFHGIGCSVKFPDAEIDWDFGHDGRLDGSDAWRLWRFAVEGTANFPEFKRKEKLDSAFSQALAAGQIYAPFKHLQHDLYYLRD